MSLRSLDCCGHYDEKEVIQRLKDKVMKENLMLPLVLAYLKESL